MEIPNAPRAIHSKAIDLACEGDRVWFEQNPDRLYRLRDAVPFENNGPLELPPYGMAWRIIVTQIRDGARFRMLVALPESLQTTGLDDKPLATLFKQAWPDAKKVLKAARRAVNKYETPRVNANRPSWTVR
jgi:hypothetical protein